MFLCFEAFQHQNVLILFLYSMKHSYLLMPITTSYVNHSSTWGH